MTVVVREWRTDDVADVTRMLADYHLQTEAEKGRPVAGVDALSAAYRSEVADPAVAFAGATVLVAEREGAVAGTVVRTRDGELKRLWVDAAFRGSGAGRALLDAAAERGGTLRLSVWRWRTGAIALYGRAGFRLVPSWDPRPDLVCMERDQPPANGGSTSTSVPEPSAASSSAREPSTSTEQRGRMSPSSG